MQPPRIKANSSRSALRCNIDRTPMKEQHNGKEASGQDYHSMDSPMAIKADYLNFKSKRMAEMSRHLADTPMPPSPSRHDSHADVLFKVRF